MVHNHSKKILFANFPADGHFNPLTGLAVHLRELGHDVRWYTSASFAGRLEKLQITHYPFKRAMEVSDGNFDKVFPERTKIKSQVKKLCFDLIHAFILRAPEYFADIEEIEKEFPFDLVICDCCFTGIPFIKEKIRKPVISIGVLPLTETSRDLPPVGLGMTPSGSFFGRKKQAALRWFADKVLFREPNAVMAATFGKYGINARGSNVFDVLVRKSTLLLQSGTPGFEYRRSDLGKNIRFIGALLPYSGKKKTAAWHDEKLGRYEKVILVTQGTVEKDISKLLVPTLEAFKDSDHLVIVTTGGSGTRELRQKYPQDNIIIEDFIPFSDVMPLADVYITNGGYGGVMLSIGNKLPLVVAGVHEGKNEINARVGYFKIGINLRTEQPLPLQLRASVEEIYRNAGYRKNIKKLSQEFRQYSPSLLCAGYVDDLLETNKLSPMAPELLNY